MTVPELKCENNEGNQIQRQGAWLGGGALARQARGPGLLPAKELTSSAAAEPGQNVVQNPGPEPVLWPCAGRSRSTQPLPRRGRRSRLQGSGGHQPSPSTWQSGSGLLACTGLFLPSCTVGKGILAPSQHQAELPHKGGIQGRLLGQVPVPMPQPPSSRVMRWGGKKGSEPLLGPAWEPPPGHLPWTRVEVCRVLASTEPGARGSFRLCVWENEKPVQRERWRSGRQAGSAKAGVAKAPSVSGDLLVFGRFSFK